MKKRILCVLTEAMLYLLIALVAFLMLLILASQRARDIFASYYGEAFLIAFVLVAGAFAFWILFELVFIMRTVHDDPFVKRNIRAFYRMGIAALLAAVFFVVKSVADYTLMTAVCALVMMLSGLFSLVLAVVFDRAVAYKDENDLTI